MKESDGTGRIDIVCAGKQDRAHRAWGGGKPVENRKKLVIIHTTPFTVQSLGTLCAKLLPGVKVNHCLDDSVLQEINAEGRITPSCRYRFFALIGVAAAARPDAVLSACSSVGGMLEEARAIFPVPLARIDEPMARIAAGREGSIAVCATVQSTLGPTTELIRRYAGGERSVNTILLAEAGKLLAAGDREGYLDAVAARLGEAASGNGTVVLAQASMAEALERIPAELRGRFLTSPESGVSALRPLFGIA